MLQTKNIDWQKIVLYLVLIAFIFAYGRSCESQKGLETAHRNSVKKADSLSVIAKNSIDAANSLNLKLADLNQQYNLIEKEVYKLTNERNELKNATKLRIEKVKRFTNKEMQSYFDENYGNSTNSVVHLDSVPAKKVITDLEIGKGAIKEAENLYEENSKINLQIDNLQKQKSTLEFQSSKNLEAYLNEQKSNSINKKDAVDNLNLYEKEKKHKTLWKLSAIPAFILGVLIAK